MINEKELRKVLQDVELQFTSTEMDWITGDWYELQIGRELVRTSDHSMFQHPEFQRVTGCCLQGAVILALGLEGKDCLYRRRAVGNQLDKLVREKTKEKYRYAVALNDEGGSEETFKFLSELREESGESQ